MGPRNEFLPRRWIWKSYIVAPSLGHGVPPSGVSSSSGGLSFLELRPLSHLLMATARGMCMWFLLLRWVGCPLQVFYTFFVSLTVFPGIATSIEPTDELVSSQWFGIIIVVCAET